MPGCVLVEVGERIAAKQTRRASKTMVIFFTARNGQARQAARCARPHQLKTTRLK